MRWIWICEDAWDYRDEKERFWARAREELDQSRAGGSENSASLPIRERKNLSMPSMPCYGNAYLLWLCTSKDKILEAKKWADISPGLRETVHSNNGRPELDIDKQEYDAMASNKDIRVTVGVGLRNGTRYAVCPRCGKKGYYKVSCFYEQCRYCKLYRILLPGQDF